MLNLELLNKAQRLFRMVREDQPVVICIDVDYVQLRAEAFLETFKNYTVRIDADLHLHLETCHDGTQYVTVVLAGEPLYAKLKEKAPVGQDSEQGAKEKSTSIE